MRIPRRVTFLQLLRQSDTDLDHGVRIALTREKGNNDVIKSSLSDFDCIEIPCISFRRIDNIKEFKSLLSSHDYVLITSPQAATIFSSSWTDTELKNMKVASVGKGTSLKLGEYGIIPIFEATDASAAGLAKELPLSLGKKVLYPCSKLVKEIHPMFGERGIEISRLDTYTTVPARWSEQALENARNVQVTTFASPSAVKYWVKKVGTSAKAVAIGATTARAARIAGFKQVYCPAGKSQGIEPFIELIRDVASGKPTQEWNLPGSLTDV